MSSGIEIPPKILVLTDEHEIKLALKASGLLCAVQEYMRDLRTIYKHGEDEDLSESAWWAREKLANYLQNFNINIDELG